MTEALRLPTGAAAREAWNALPVQVRQQAIWAAEHGEPHPDPAIAAIIVGAARHDRTLHRHLTRLVGGLGATMFFAAWLTMYYFGEHREIEGRFWLPIRGGTSDPEADLPARPADARRRRVRTPPPRTVERRPRRLPHRPTAIGPQR